MEGLPDADATSELQRKENIHHSDIAVNQENRGCPILVDSDEDILGPETPGVQPLVPRLKRIQQEKCKVWGKKGSSFQDSSKRLKLLHDSKTENKNDAKVSEMTSKFEWLDPSRIRDANGRRPADPLYDKRTLYIPPGALRTMTATQKQYWNVKCQYMDVVLFFKVVS